MRWAWILFAWGCGGETEPPTCPDPPTYIRDVRPITQRLCLPCHDSALPVDRRNGAPVGLDFDDFARIQPNAAAFADAMTSGRMPPQGQGVATPAERSTVSQWRSCGYTE